jgi:cell division protein FtsB
MKTINLLPKARQEEFYYQGLLRSLWIYVAISCVTFALVFLAQFGTKLYMQNIKAGVEVKIQQLKLQVSKEENSKIKNEIAQVNNISADYNKLVAEQPKWSKVIMAFAPLPPEGVVIRTFSASLNTKAITIQGFSPTREKVQELYKRILNDTEHFTGINYPLENIAKPTDVNFHFTFTIKDELLK